MNAEENLNTLLGKLQNSFRSETVVGKATQVGDITIIPVMDVSLGLMEHHGKSGGAAMGVRAAPNSVMVIKGDEVTVLSLNNKEQNNNEQKNLKEESI